MRGEDLQRHRISGVHALNCDCARVDARACVMITNEFRLSLKVGSIFGAVFETQNASRFATFYRFVTPQTFNIPSQYVTLHVTNDRFGALPPYACALAQTSGVASVIANNRIPHDLISGTFRRLTPDQPVKFPHNLGTAAVSSTLLARIG